MGGVIVVVVVAVAVVVSKGQPDRESMVSRAGLASGWFDGII